MLTAAPSAMTANTQPGVTPTREPMLRQYFVGFQPGNFTLQRVERSDLVQQRLIRAVYGFRPVCLIPWLGDRDDDARGVGLKDPQGERVIAPDADDFAGSDEVRSKELAEHDRRPLLVSDVRGAELQFIEQLADLLPLHQGDAAAFAQPAGEEGKDILFCFLFLGTVADAADP